MELSTTPEHLEGILKSTMLYKGGNATSEVTGKFTKDFALFHVTDLVICGIVAKYNKDYFLEFKSKEEVVTLTERLQKTLRYGFNDIKLTLSTEGDKIIIKSASDHYEEDKIVGEYEELSVPMEMYKEGFFPHGLQQGVFKIKTDDFNFSRFPGKAYEIEINAENIKVSLADDTSRYTKTITPLEIREPYTTIEPDKDDPDKEVPEIQPIPLKAKVNHKLEFDGDFLQRIFNNLSGEAWLVMYKEGLAIGQMDSNHHLTYILRARIET